VGVELHVYADCCFSELPLQKQFQLVHSVPFSRHGIAEIAHMVQNNPLHNKSQCPIKANSD